MSLLFQQIILPSFIFIAFTFGISLPVAKESQYLLTEAKGGNTLFPFKFIEVDLSDFSYDYEDQPLGGGANVVNLSAPASHSNVFKPPIHVKSGIVSLRIDGNPIELESNHLSNGFIRTKYFGKLELFLESINFLKSGGVAVTCQIRGTDFQIGKISEWIDSNNVKKLKKGRSVTPLSKIDMANYVPNSIELSPDYMRIAYECRINDTSYIILDGQKSKGYKSIHLSPRFSFDGEHMAYCAGIGDKQAIVIDGREEKQYDEIFNFTYKFSPDGKHFVYAARAGNKFFMVIDGNEEKAYDSIRILSPEFSPDSKHLAYVAQEGEKYFVVIDKKEGKAFDGVVIEMDQGILFETPMRFSYLAKLGNDIFQVKTSFR